MRLREAAPRPTPTGPARPMLPREFVVEHQRLRIIEGLAEEAAEKGYRAVTVAGVVKRAGVARNTFYENFSGKEDCFFAACDLAEEEVETLVVGAVAAAGDSWPGSIRAAIRSLLEFASSDSPLARIYLVESLFAGPTAAERYERAVRRAAPLFRRGRNQSPYGEKLPLTLEETIVGGIFWVVYQRLVLNRPQELQALLPELAEFALAPYLGPGASAE